MLKINHHFSRFCKILDILIISRKAYISFLFHSLPYACDPHVKRMMSWPLGNPALHGSHSTGNNTCLVSTLFSFVREAVLCLKMLGNDGKDTVICYLGNWRWMSLPFVWCRLWPLCLFP